MIKVQVLYPNTKGNRFDMAYYLGTHIPLVQRKLGEALKGVAVEHGLAGMETGSPPTYLVLAHLSFESVEAFLAAFGAHAQAIMADIPNYTDIQPVIQLSEVKI